MLWYLVERDVKCHKKEFQVCLDKKGAVFVTMKLTRTC